MPFMDTPRIPISSEGVKEPLIFQGENPTACIFSDARKDLALRSDPKRSLLDYYLQDLVQYGVKIETYTNDGSIKVLRDVDKSRLYLAPTPKIEDFAKRMPLIGKSFRNTAKLSVSMNGHGILITSDDANLDKRDSPIRFRMPTGLDYYVFPNFPYEGELAMKLLLKGESFNLTDYFS